MRWEAKSTSTELSGVRVGIPVAVPHGLWASYGLWYNFRKFGVAEPLGFPNAVPPEPMSHAYHRRSRDFEPIWV